MENEFRKKKQYRRAKRRVRQIKAFYIHLLVNFFTLTIIISVNLIFSPSYHWFWFVVFGIGLASLIHWFAVFGENTLGLGKDWEERKIKELINKNN